MTVSAVRTGTGCPKAAEARSGAEGRRIDCPRFSEKFHRAKSREAHRIFVGTILMGGGGSVSEGS